MEQIEPNIAALGWFVALWSMCCLGFFQLAGLYPLRRASRRRFANLLVVTATVLWAALLAATMHFACAELRWSTIVIVSGILFLFLPDLFQVLPRRLRDGPSGLILSASAFAIALILLVPNPVGGMFQPI